MRTWTNPFISLNFSEFWQFHPVFRYRYVANTKQPVGKTYLKDSLR